MRAIWLKYWAMLNEERSLAAIAYLTGVAGAVIVGLVTAAWSVYVYFAEREPMSALPITSPKLFTDPTNKPFGLQDLLGDRFTIKPEDFVKSRVVTGNNSDFLEIVSSDEELVENNIRVEGDSESIMFIGERLTNPIRSLTNDEESTLFLNFREAMMEQSFFGSDVFYDLDAEPGDLDKVMVTACFDDRDECPNPSIVFGSEELAQLREEMPTLNDFEERLFGTVKDYCNQYFDPPIERPSLLLGTRFRRKESGKSQGDSLKGFPFDSVYWLAFGC